MFVYHSCDAAFIMPQWKRSQNKTAQGTALYQPKKTVVIPGPPSALASHATTDGDFILSGTTAN